MPRKRSQGEGSSAPRQLRWRSGAAADAPVPGLRDARAELERTLGRLP